MNEDLRPESCSSSECGCTTGMDRRGFIKLAGLGAASALAPLAGLPVVAGPFPAQNGSFPVPADKKLTPEWVHALSARGTQTVYRGAELDKIGMPIGGICTGQMYLGGDGKLWNWDIFNVHRGTGDGHYARPEKAASSVDQGFALLVESDGKAQDRTLDRAGFPGVTFRGEYPIGFVDYHDEHCPVAIGMEAFSPFIPLNADDSGLPAIVLQFTLKNTGAAPADVHLLGWLQNAVCLAEAGGMAIPRSSRILKHAGVTFLEHSADRADKPAGSKPVVSVSERADFGTMGLALLDPKADDVAHVSLPDGPLQAAQFTGGSKAQETHVLGKKLHGGLGRRWTLQPGEEAKATFVVTWCFPNLRLEGLKGTVGRHYASRFSGAAAVARYVAENFAHLADQTRLWHRTWYDSTLPYWLLDRLFANTSILATSTCHRLQNGRFYGWEGVGCCVGTCTHVWHYAHAVARLFPELERSAREMQDLGTAFVPETGLVRFRGETCGDTYATDGQAGVILRCYREHQMSVDNAFLQRNWPRIKKAMEFLIRQDGNDDGVIENAQPNTLDTAFYGPNAMISSLYLAALRAAEEMAREAGDDAFARRVRPIFESGSRRLVANLWNGEYFIQKPDPRHPEALKTGNGSFIDQVFGQSWAHQVGLGRILPRDHVQQALQSLWKYNWTPDVGPYRAIHKNGRWYAMPGEGGLIMCTWPKGGGEDASGTVNPGFAGYLNEVMNGFEYQAAGHMVWEGLLTEGLAVCRAIHERYHATRRNPWNEIECGDHYARSMASYGVFLAVCGYEYHGPRAHLAFAPRLTPEDFRAPFTTAEGWGTFAQKRTGDGQHETLALHWGKLRLRTLAFAVANDRPAKVTVTLGHKTIEATHRQADGRVTISLSAELVLAASQRLEVAMA